MAELLIALGVGVVVFAATNIDDIFVLLVFFSDPRFSTRQVIVGQYAGIAALTVASVAVSLIGLVIPSSYVGLLGLAPLAIGVKKLLERRDGEPGTTTPRAGTNVFTVAAVTVANGGDNIAVYAPLFATKRAWEVAAITAVFGTMTAVWCVVGHQLVQHPTLGKPIRRYGRALLPWVLICLGVYIVVGSRALGL